MSPDMTHQSAILERKQNSRKEHHEFFIAFILFLTLNSCFIVLLYLHLFFTFDWRISWCKYSSSSIHRWIICELPFTKFRMRYSRPFNPYASTSRFRSFDMHFWWCCVDNVFKRYCEYITYTSFFVRIFRYFVCCL